MTKIKKERDIVLFVSLHPVLKGIVQDMKKRSGREHDIALLYHHKPKTESQKEALEAFDLTLRCNFDSPKSIISALKPHKHLITAITARGESNIPALQKIIPYLPYLRTPTTESLEWSTNKLIMRRRFAAYDRSITPKFRLVHDAGKKTLKEIEEKVGFPLVIKPIGLNTSLLVNIAYHRDELDSTLKKVLRKIRSLHKENSGRGEPSVLVEEFMEGDMYSVDAHVGSRGKIHFNPMVHIKTGRTVGFDDFFAYQTMTPTQLNKTSIKDAREVATKAVYALGLRSTTAHIELLKTEGGWKVIEVGPRVGGFRDRMYNLSYGIDITANDIAVRIPSKINIPQKVKGYTAVLKVFPKKEGRIKTLTGIKKAQSLKSFYAIKINKKVGDQARFAKHGGKDIFNVTFFNKDRSKLLADIRRFEQMVKVETTNIKVKTKL